jgi:hypothetical protein
MYSVYKHYTSLIAYIGQDEYLCRHTHRTEKTASTIAIALDQLMLGVVEGRDYFWRLAACPAIRKQVCKL